MAYGSFSSDLERTMLVDLCRLLEFVQHSQACSSPKENIQTACLNREN